MLFRSPKELEVYLEQDPVRITKQKALYTLDGLCGYFESVMGQLYLISMVHPDKEVAAAARTEAEKLERLFIDLFSMNLNLYLFLKKYQEQGADKEELSLEENPN